MYKVSPYVYAHTYPNNILTHLHAEHQIYPINISLNYIKYQTDINSPFETITLKDLLQLTGQ